MKIWHGYGSDHSASLVMIGEFKTVEDAERVYDLINTLSENAQSDLASGIINHWAKNERFSEETEGTLRELKLYNLSPSDIADFANLNPSIEKQNNVLRLRSDDIDIGAFVKLMVDQGAKVQVYSSHNYPESDEK